MKPLLICILMLGSTYWVKGQDLPTHPSKIHVAPNNKVYINKSLPVYFYISSSTDSNANHYLLKSETTPKFSNPMYFDSEGVNTLHSPSAVDPVTKKVIMPKKDVEFQVYVDSKPPSTTILYNKHREYLLKGTHYMSDSATISFSGTDALSGVENTYVSVNGEPYKSQNKLMLDQQKEYHIKYYSVDHTGNVEHMREVNFSIDQTPPVSQLSVSGKKFEDNLPSNAYFEIAARDDVSGLKRIYVSMDDSVFKPYSGKMNVSQLKQGKHKLFFYSTDEVDNNEKVNTYTFFIDKTPPRVIEEIEGKTFSASGKEFSAGKAKLRITAKDNKAGVNEIYYSINKGPYIKYEEPISLAGYKGDLLITSYAIDNVGNSSKDDNSNSQSSSSFSYVDLNAPWVGHSLKGPNVMNLDSVYIGGNTKIILEAKDAESGINRIEYQIDSSNLLRYDSPFMLPNEGHYHISTFGYDNTENLTRQGFDLVVDVTGPEIFEQFSAPETNTIENSGKKYTQYPAHVVVFLAATDVKSGLQSLTYELNNNPRTPYTREIKGFIRGKLNMLKVKAVDKLGNKTEKVIEFYVK